MPELPTVAAPFHVGLIVPDVHEAVERFARLYGWRWAEIQPRRHNYRAFPSGGRRAADVQVTFSLSSPSRIELISHADGSPWTVTDGATLHHIAWWSDDLAADAERLEARGAVREFHGIDPETGDEPWRFVYLREGAMRIELLDSGVRPLFEAWFSSSTKEETDAPA
jgi:hypothetical protein